MDATIREIIHAITRLVELTGIAIILVGMITSTVGFLRGAGASHDREGQIRNYRAGLGRAILVGLEFLVAADIVNTVAVSPTLYGVGVLAGIVLIRTFLSLSLDVEIEGRWPWERAATTARPPT